MRATVILVAVLSTVMPAHALVLASGWGVVEARRAPAAAPSTEASSKAEKPTGRSCCKVCRKGKACGNACISRAYTCRQPPGCACGAE